MSFFGTRRQIEPTSTSSTSPIEPPQPPKPPPQSPVGFETVLGSNCVIEGVMRSNANVRLDGTFTGTLEINGNVLVGETAKVTADINARNISIAGAVRGNVNGKKVQLLRTGRVWGDIRATALTTEEGAFIDGKITMVSHEAAPASSTSEMKPVTTDSAETASGPVEDTAPESLVDAQPEPGADAVPIESETSSDQPDSSEEERPQGSM